MIYKGRITGGVYESDPQTCEYEKIQINNHNATVATVYRIGDARLIAAAPELLEALRKVVAISDRKHDAWDKAKAAIAKAEGRT